MRHRVSLGLALATGMACSSAETGPYRPANAQTRDSTRAGKLSREAADLVSSDPKQAEELLREALTADLFCGAAHNNLGVLYLKQGKLYEAANELEWARKLLPGDPEPRLNLALTLERAGHTDEALATYKTALEVAPEHIATIQALAALQVRHELTDDQLIGRLKRIALQGEDELWRRWAREQRIRLER